MINEELANEMVRIIMQGYTKFRLFDTVRHKATGKLYQIHATPDYCYIEKDTVPAYTYQDPQSFTIWVRPQVEMEERFELA